MESHLPRGRMDATWQTTFLSAVLTDENLEFRLKFHRSVDNKPALVQVMAWRRKATSHYLTSHGVVYDVCLRHSTSMC